jgi:hypothetical protein
MRHLSSRIRLTWQTRDRDVCFGKALNYIQVLSDGCDHTSILQFALSGGAVNRCTTNRYHAIKVPIR